MRLRYERRYIQEQLTEADLSELSTYLQSLLVPKPGELVEVKSFNGGREVSIRVGTKYEQYPKFYSLSLLSGGFVIIKLSFQQVKVGDSLADPRAAYTTTSAKRITSNRKVNKQAEATSVDQAKKAIAKFVALAQQT